jgi:ribosomal protein L37AE/L43A
MTEHDRQRKLKWYDTGSFSGWGCSACGWHIASTATPNDKIVNKLVREAFERHECKGHPRRKGNSGSDPE